MKSIAGKSYIELAMEMIREYEGFSEKVYKCPAGLATIGYGFTNKITSSLNTTNKQLLQECFTKSCIDKERADTILENICDKLGYEIMDYNAALGSAVYNFSNNELGSLISFAYNVGIKAYFSSSLYNEVTKGAKDYKKIQECFLKWNKATIDGKKVELKGLTARRQAEFELFRGETIKG